MSKSKLVAVVVTVLLIWVLQGCAIRFKGMPLLSVDPNGELLYHHPEDHAQTNRGLAPVH